MRFLAFRWMMILGILGISNLEASSKRDDRFTVYDVIIDVQDVSAAQARLKAINQGQRLALQMLVKRLDPVYDDQDAFSKLKDEQIEKLVQDFEIQQEKNSAVRYVATFTFRFKENLVEALLQERHSSPKNPALSPVLKTPTLIIPVFQNAAGLLLWEENNLWRQHWDQNSEISLDSYILPIGDLSDRSHLTAQDAEKGKLESLQILMNRYQTRRVVVALVKEDYLPSLTLYAYNFRGLEGMKTISLSEFLGSLPDFTEAAKNTLQQVREIPKASESGSLAEGQLTCDVRIDDFQTWRHIQNIFARLRLLRHRSLNSLNPDYATVTFTFAGDREMFLTELRSSGFEVEEGPDRSSVPLLTLKVQGDLR